MRITRRNFIKWVSASAAAAGLSQASTFKLMDAFANPDGVLGNVPQIVWLQGQNCTGCSTSFLGTILKGSETPNNSSLDITTILQAFRGNVTGYEGWDNTNGQTGSPSSYSWTGLATLLGDPLSDTGYYGIEDVALDVLDVRYHSTVMGGAGALAMNQTTDTQAPSGTGSYGLASWLDGGANSGQTYVLVVEGSIPDDEFCTIGRMEGRGFVDDEIPIYDAVTGVAKNAAAVVATGTCATWGGIPAAVNLRAKGTQYRKTNALPVSTVLSNAGLTKTLVNIPGCPIQPDVWTLAALGAIYYVGSGNTLTGVFEGLDSLNRPKPWFDNLMHVGGYTKGTGQSTSTDTSKGCPRYTDYTSWYYATTRGQTNGCLIGLGCKGPSTHTPCARSGWNNSRNYYGTSKHCIQGGHPCYGCTEKGFPDKFEPFLNYE